MIGACESATANAPEGHHARWLVDQLPPTLLAQVATIIALRLTNASDQSTIRAALPEGVAGLADAQASLRTGEAIVSGEAVALPSRLVIDPPSPWPSAGDLTLESWRMPQKINDLVGPIARWRGKAADA